VPEAGVGRSRGPGQNEPTGLGGSVGGRFGGGLGASFYSVLQINANFLVASAEMYLC
jgi:hypothetical protein